MQNKLSKIESQISDLESEIADIDIALAENYEEVSSKPDFFDMYQGKKDKIDTLMEQWEEIEGKVTTYS